VSDPVAAARALLAIGEAYLKRGATAEAALSLRRAARWAAEEALDDDLARIADLQIRAGDAEGARKTRAEIHRVAVEAWAEVATELHAIEAVIDLGAAKRRAATETTGGEQVLAREVPGRLAEVALSLARALARASRQPMR
jgi:hypothetical protein